MKRYLCIGGPLDGQMLTSNDLKPEFVALRSVGGWNKGDVIAEGGLYSRYGNQYHDYNRGNGYSRGPSMVRIHESLLT